MTSNVKELKSKLTARISNMNETNNEMRKAVITQKQRRGDEWNHGKDR